MEGIADVKKIAVKIVENNKNFTFTISKISSTIVVWYLFRCVFRQLLSNSERIL